MLQHWVAGSKRILYKSQGGPFACGMAVLARTARRRLSLAVPEPPNVPQLLQEAMVEKVQKKLGGNR